MLCVLFPTAKGVPEGDVSCKYLSLNRLLNFNVRAPVHKIPIFDKIVENAPAFG
jgi:hypothetical protein